MKKRLPILILICILVVTLCIVCACEIAKVTITFALNYEGATSLTRTGLFGTTVDAPLPARDGYDFVGWYRDSECTDPVDIDNLVFVSDVTFFAKWKKTAILESITAEYTGGSILKGEKIDSNQLVVTAYYSDDTSKTLSVYSLILDNNTAGKQTATVTYTEGGITKIATFQVFVVERKLVSITANYTSDIVAGTHLDLSKLIVTAHYEVGSEPVDASKCVLSEIDLLSTGEQTLTVSYTENGITATTTCIVKVVPVAVVSMTVEYDGEKTIFVGEQIDQEKITVTARYNNGIEETLLPDEYTIEYDSSKVGNWPVTIYCKQDAKISASFYVSVVRAKLVRIEAAYIGGELITYEVIGIGDFAVTAFYEDGRSEQVTEGVTFTPPVFGEPGEYSVTVTYVNTYGEKAEATVKVTVSNGKLLRIEIEKSLSDPFVEDHVRDYIAVQAFFERPDYYDGPISKTVTDYALSAETFTQLGEQTITVTYTVGDVAVTEDAVFNVRAWELKTIAAEYDGTLEIDEKINPSKVTVTASYTHGKSKQVTDFTVTSIDENYSSAPGEKTFSVSYSENGVEKKCALSLAVVARVKSISAEYTGGDIKVGKDIDRSKISVTVCYNYSVDGQPFTQPVSGADNAVTVAPISFDDVGEQTVRVSFQRDEGYLQGSGTTSFTVNVLPLRLERIQAVYNGGRILVGTQPQKTDLVVTAYYEDGSSKTVTNFNAPLLDSATPGDKIWEISYTENDVTEQTTVTVKVVESFGPTEGKYDVDVIKDEELSIHFLMLGNRYTGDSVYIKAGETDILIDAGSRYDSASTIEKYVKQYCTDGKLEYVVATHAHQDHIEGFVSGSGNGGGVLDRFKVDNIITYAGKKTTSKISGYFTDKLNALKSQGVNVITAKDCIDNTNGGQKEYVLAEGITMEILDQRYYHQSTSEENDYSVCLMIKQGENNYLFTGDLEKNGEESLAALNDLPKVKLWKGGHHGSYTAGNEALLREIQPETVCICTCMGTTEYTQGQMTTSSFPALAFVERVAQYTDRVYCTTDGTNYANDLSNTCKPANGNIVFACTNEQITMYFSNNNLKLKETDWFKTTSWFKNSTKFPDNWRV